MRLPASSKRREATRRPVQTSKNHALPSAGRAGCTTRRPGTLDHLGRRDTMPALPATVLVHATSQAVPQVVQEGLAQIGVQLTRDARLMNLVPSMYGHVENRLEEDRDFLVGVFGFASVVILPLWAMLAVCGPWQRRKVPTVTKCAAQVSSAASTASCAHGHGECLLGAQRGTPPGAAWRVRRQSFAEAARLRSPR